MAIISGNLNRLPLKYPELDLSQLRFVGWGAGQFFNYQYPFLKDHLKLAYMVCPNPDNQGQTMLGLEVRSPDALRNEPIGTTVVVIFAERYYDVMHALRDQFDDLLCVNACSLEDDEALLMEMEEFRQLEITPLVRKWKHPPPSWYLYPRHGYGAHAIRFGMESLTSSRCVSMHCNLGPSGPCIIGPVQALARPIDSGPPPATPRVVISKCHSTICQAWG
jgi:hypothetical protein